MKKTTKKPRALKTRNSGTMTESGFWGFIRSALRQKSRWWKPRLNALNNFKRASQSTNKRLKWEFQCQKCFSWFPQKEVEVHHMIEAGSLNCKEDLPGFVERLFAEQGWVALCKTCHANEHNKEKK